MLISKNDIKLQRTPTKSTVQSVLPSTAKGFLAMTSHSFSDKSFDLETYDYLNAIPAQDLLALSAFSFFVQLDQPMRVFGENAIAFEEEILTGGVSFERSGEISLTPTNSSFFSMKLSFSRDELDSHVNKHKTASSTEDEIQVFCMDSYIGQVMPQMWDLAHLFNGEIDHELKHQLILNLMQMTSENGLNAKIIYSSIMLPLLAMLRPNAVN